MPRLIVKTPKAPAHSPEEKRALGSLLAVARKSAGYSLESAAAALTASGYGIGKAALGHWETGTNVPDALWVRRLARLYGTSTDVLTGTDSNVPIWPFSMELQCEVLNLPPEDIRDMEVAIWAHLRKAVPEQLHYQNANEMHSREVPKPATIVTPGTSSRTGSKRTA